MKNLGFPAALALGLAAASPAQARDPFSLSLDVDGNSGSRGFNSIENVVDALSTNALRGLAPSYTDVSAATARLDLRGAPALAAYASNSPALRVQIPVAGIDRTFQGSTREESARLFQRFLEGRDGAGSLNSLLRATTHTSPIDPVAGGPNSALTQLAVADFGRAVQGSFGERGGVGIGARIGSFTAAGYDSWNLTIPIDANWRITERDTVSFEAPIAYTSAGGAASYSGNIGMLYRRRVSEEWQVQVSGRVGAAGSVDLGAGSGVYGLGLVSTLRMPISETWRVTLVNGINYVSTFASSIGRTVIDYNVSNTIFRNGIIVSRDLGLEVGGMALAASAYAIDTRFTGSPVFVRNFQEFGVFVSPAANPRFGVGVQLMTGDRSLFGFTISTGVKF